MAPAAVSLLFNVEQELSERIYAHANRLSVTAIRNHSHWGNLWKGYKYSKQQIQQLLKDIQLYKLHEEPYSVLPVDGELASLKLYWKEILSNDENLELPKLAILMLDIKPHAADPEKTVSLMGWYDSARRSQLLSATTTAMTTIKMHYQNLKDR